MLEIVRMQAERKSALQRIMVLGSSLAAGFGTASLEALQPNFSFRVSLKTLGAFIFGFATLYIYWRILFHPSKGPGWKWLRISASALLALGGVAAFLYPLRFITPGKRQDVAVGLAIAFCALLGVATLLFWCRRFLENDAERTAR